MMLGLTGDVFGDDFLLDLAGGLCEIASRPNIASFQLEILCT
jgi:hypothetical protein